MEYTFIPLPGDFENHLRFFSTYDSAYDVHFSYNEGQFKYVGDHLSFLPLVQSVVSWFKGYHDDQLKPSILKLLQEMALAKKEANGENVMHRRLQGRAEAYKKYGEAATIGVNALMKRAEIIIRDEEIEACYQKAIRIGHPLSET